MHFSRPSGQRLSWCLPWNLGAVGFFSSGYWTVSTFLNICRKVTPNPLIGFRKSGTGDLLDTGIRRLLLQRRHAGPDAVVVRQVKRRNRERAAILLGRFGFLQRSQPRGPAFAGVIRAERH